MKASKKAFTEWAADEINFYNGPNTVYTKEELENLCKAMLVVNDNGVVLSLPPLMDVIQNIYKVFLCTPNGHESFKLWGKAFFSPQNIVRFTSIYDVKRSLEKKLSRLTSSPRLKPGVSAPSVS